MNLPSESYRPCLRKPHKEGCASASTVASSLSKFCGTRLVLPLSFIPATSGFRAGTELRFCLDQWHPLQNVCCNDSFRAGLSMRMHKKAMRTSMETIEAEQHEFWLEIQIADRASRHCNDSLQPDKGTGDFREPELHGKLSFSSSCPEGKRGLPGRVGKKLEPAGRGDLSFQDRTKQDKDSTRRSNLSVCPLIANRNASETCALGLQQLQPHGCFASN